MSAAAAIGRERGNAADIVRVYVWELPVRAAHWIVAGSILVLATTGFYIGHPFISVPGPARDHFVTGTIKVVHFYAAIVFTLAVLVRVGWMFVGNRFARWSQFVPKSRGRWQNGFEMLEFYLSVRREPPPAVGHNALAGITYGLVFLFFFTMIGTGLAMHSASAAVTSPMRIFAGLIPIFGGLQHARWIHHVVMWVLIAFALHHVTSAVLISVVEPNATIIGSIFSGYKFVRRAALKAHEDE